ncbi:MAG: hypothetical protein V4632_06020 [Pseudomonadota bacterium]
MTKNNLANIASNTPATFFLKLWQITSALTASQRTTGENPPTDFIKEVDAALTEDSGNGAYKRLEALETGFKGSKQEINGMRLAIMVRIDQAFLLIHPRSVLVSAASAKRPVVAKWLREIRDNRIVTGNYFESGQFLVIPRGPLVRNARTEYVANAENLADRFTAVTVINLSAAQLDKPIVVRHKIIGPDAARGVGLGKKDGREHIAFIPVAELASELTISERLIPNGSILLDYRLDETIKPSERIIGALKLIDDIDIAIAPELVMTEVQADELSIACLVEDFNSPRIIIAGSGQTTSQEDEQSWNEARIINGLGAELWRQRKIWPAGITSSQAVDLRLSSEGSGLYMEDTASGTELLIVDVDGLGRCVVLICQDIKLAAVHSLLDQFQPDWVFTPILDKGVDIGRWAHQEVFALSEISRARFLICTSTSLALKLDSKATPHCALALGPKTSDNDDEGGLVTKSKVVEGSSPGYAFLAWRDGKWDKTSLGTR